MRLESTPMVRNGHRRSDLDLYSPIVQQPDFSAIPENSGDWGEFHVKNETYESDPVPLSIRDLSTWLGGKIIFFPIIIWMSPC